MTPRHPVYVISKGRADCCLTARFLIKDGTPFRIVVEPQERAAYAEEFNDDRLLVLPFSNLGLGSVPARNWVWDHAVSSGASSHWILDDNIRSTRRLFRGKRIRCSSSYALAIVEAFVDRYDNVGIAGLNYQMFVANNTTVPFYLNVHVYSCLLIDHRLEHRWRGRYNEDTDLCLQTLSAGWCTVLTNAFMIEKMRTMVMKGGNTHELYSGDGRLRMARDLERRWPGVVEVRRRFGRPQHFIKGHWRYFDTPLRRRAGVVVPAGPDERGLVLQAVREVKAPGLRRLLGAP